MRNRIWLPKILDQGSSVCVAAENMQPGYCFGACWPKFVCPILISGSTCRMWKRRRVKNLRGSLHSKLQPHDLVLGLCYSVSVAYSAPFHHFQLFHNCIFNILKQPHVPRRCMHHVLMCVVLNVAWTNTCASTDLFVEICRIWNHWQRHRRASCGAWWHFVTVQWSVQFHGIFCKGL